jgi:hypothetical protein
LAYISGADETQFAHDAISPKSISRGKGASSHLVRRIHRGRTERCSTKATAERPHFFIAYGTKSAEGLKTFRETEYDALRRHAKDRANAIEARREERLNVADLFAGHRAELSEATVEEIVAEQKRLAAARILELLAQQGPLKFSQIVAALLQPFMLRKTNVKDVCVDLAKVGKIENVWGSGNRKPRDEDVIRLRAEVT